MDSDSDLAQLCATFSASPFIMAFAQVRATPTCLLCITMCHDTAHRAAYAHVGTTQLSLHHRAQCAASLGSSGSREPSWLIHQYVLQVLSSRTDLAPLALQHICTSRSSSTSLTSHGWCSLLPLPCQPQEAAGSSAAAMGTQAQVGGTGGLLQHQASPGMPVQAFLQADERFQALCR